MGEVIEIQNIGFFKARQQHILGEQVENLSPKNIVKLIRNILVQSHFAELVDMEIDKFVIQKSFGMRQEDETLQSMVEVNLLVEKLDSKTHNEI